MMQFLRFQAPFQQTKWPQELYKSVTRGNELQIGMGPLKLQPD